MSWRKRPLILSWEWIWTLCSLSRRRSRTPRTRPASGFSSHDTRYMPELFIFGTVTVLGLLIPPWSGPRRQPIRRRNETRQIEIRGNDRAWRRRSRQRVARRRGRRTWRQYRISGYGDGERQFRTRASIVVLQLKLPGIPVREIGGGRRPPVNEIRSRRIYLSSMELISVAVQEAISIHRRDWPGSAPMSNLTEEYWPND